MTDKPENLLLLGEITTYNEEKDDLYNKLISGETKEFISTESKQLSNDFSKELLSLSYNESFEKFREFFNREYNNNTGIGKYFYDKINELNNIIEEKKKRQEANELELQRLTTIQNTNKKHLDDKHNKITIQKVYIHLAVVSLCIFVLMNLINILNKYNFISNTIFTIFIFILTITLVVYILYTLYSKHPRQHDNYHKYKFLLDNQ
jgi:cbb3-type cytochrome oxidase subunit 3